MSSSKTITKRILSVLSSAALAASCFAAAGASIPAMTASALEAGQVANPVIWADVPDPDIIRVGDTYYMVSTTMFFSPGVPVMKSKDLVSWEICSYVYDTMADGAKQTLSNGQHDYAHGSWAASLRYNKGTFYVFFGSYGTNKSYIYKTTDIESGNWTKSEISGMYHDASMLFDDDGRNYLVYGGDGNIKIKELNSQMTGFAYGAQERTIIKTGLSGLAGEGAHIQKINGYYYVFLIAWPSGSGRIELCYRSKSLTGSFEGKTVLNSGLGTYGSGVAQGGIVDTPDGNWYGLLFQDHGSVGRIPVLVPVSWQNGWPIMGVNGKAPVVLDMPGNHAGTQLAKDDEFNYSSNKLMLEWQWNHNPDNNYWSVTERPGWLRLKNGYIAKSIINARNTLTMRTEGPSCSGVIKMDVSHMKAGDYAGLSAFQYNYGNVGVRVTDSGEKKIYMATNGNYNSNGDVMNSADKIQQEVTLYGNTVYLKTDFQFNTVDGNYNVSNNIDKVNFYYSLDGSSWTKIGTQVGMTYDLKLFTGYRNAIYSYATKSTGGYVDVDYFDYERAEWNAPTIVEPDADGYLIHDTFESGAGKWSARGGCTISTSNYTKVKGSNSLGISGRSATWNGGQRSLSTSAFVPGKSYAFSACYSTFDGADPTEFKLTLQYDLNGETNYDKIAQGTGSTGKFVQLYNPNYTIPSGASNLVLVVETTEDTCDFYVDEIIAAPVGTKIETLDSSSSQTNTNNYFFQDTFESGTNDWSARGGCTAATSTSAKYKGSRSLSLSGRTDAWNGGMKNLSSGTFVAGKSYAFSACFANLTGSDPTEFKLTLQYSKDGETYYDKIAQAYANRGEFVQLYNSKYTIPSGASDLVLVAETTEETCDFFIDEVIAAPAGTKIDGPKSNVVVAKGPARGDVNLDGEINVMDLVELRRGISKGFVNNTSKQNADVDQSGTVDNTDVTYLQSYLSGKITEFPVAATATVQYKYSSNLQYKEAPSNYFTQPAKHGTVVKEYYNGINGSKAMNVYLPYGYDKSKKYNVLYLMHGGGENENTCFNDTSIEIDLMLDNMIANGDIEPMIVVCPTFNGCPSNDGNMGAGTVWNEMRQSIIPYVEGKYSTYANGNTSISGLKASRFHRAYAGFSMGGGSTWKMLCNNLDICAYYMPLSGHCWDGASGIQNAIDKSGYSKSDYFVIAATGTKDLAYENMVPLINTLKSDTKRFTYTSDLSKGNFYFLEAPNTTHWWGYVRHYIYDALPYFFHEGQ
ncbi:family 43 glycosylhydrolase [Ruminococcus albus]|uniref:Beta-xylosidase n=1 Tax=Ruminococcus albus TaxID=1264 RepID=A0A1I1Q134_RUMAL|nr:family 43 glycosylhydrolase [Ruminococcus albus]SFD12943.1 Beta-xylosidase [Ruminococcus albus]